MAIQIVDNFQLNKAEAIDNRMVVGPNQFYTNKDDLPYKYDGMRVWDMNSNIAFVWSGSTFSTESSTSISGGGSASRIPKFVSPGNIIENSIIYDTSVNIGIGISTPDEKLTVSGNIKTIGADGFYGRGTYITNINASNITNGFLQLNRITNGANGYILTAGGGSPNWKKPSSIRVGESTSVYHEEDDTSTAYRSLVFLSTSTGTGYDELRNSSGIKVRANGYRLYVGGSVGIGIINNSTTIKLSVNGYTKLNGNVGINTNPISTYKLYVNGYTRLGDSVNGLYVYGSTILNGLTTIQNHCYVKGNNNTFSIQNNGYFHMNASGVKGAWIYRHSTNDYLAIHVSSTTVWNDGKTTNFYENGDVKVDGYLTTGAPFNEGTNHYAIAANNDQSGEIVYTQYFLNNSVISDERKKKNIKPIDKSIGIMDLTPVTFDWKDNDGMTVKGTNIGLIAQEVKELIPEAVWIDEIDETYNIQWGSIITMLIKKVQEQQVQIDNLIKD